MTGQLAAGAIVSLPNVPGTARATQAKRIKQRARELNAADLLPANAKRSA